MTIIKIASQADWSKNMKFSYEISDWLSENISPRQHKEFVWKPSGFSTTKRLANRRSVAYCRVRNQFVHETGLTLDTTAFNLFKGKGWRVYGVTHVEVTVSPEWITNIAQYDLFVKIFNDAKAVQFKLAML